jgi:hypothetical protein
MGLTDLRRPVACVVIQHLAQRSLTPLAIADAFCDSSKEGLVGLLAPARKHNTLVVESLDLRLVLPGACQLADKGSKGQDSTPPQKIGWLPQHWVLKILI